MRLTYRIGAALLALALVPAGTATAGLVNNGGFESGLSGWTTADQLGSDGTFFVQSGPSSPLNADDVPAPPEGKNAAMSDGGAPGTHVLYQDFVVPNAAATSAWVSFQLFIGNRASFGFATPANGTLDFSILTPNQQVRVDILKGGTDDFSVAAADVLMNLYQSKAGDPLVDGYKTVMADLTALFNANPGKTLRLRFAQVDNSNGQMQLGVDDVQLDARVVPEPSTIASAALAAVAGLAVARRRRKAS